MSGARETAGRAKARRARRDASIRLPDFAPYAVNRRHKEGKI